MHEKNIKEFIDSGYTLIENIINNSELDLLKQTILTISKKYLDIEIVSSENLLNSSHFNDALMNLRKTTEETHVLRLAVHSFVLANVLHRRDSSRILSALKSNTMFV